MHARDLDELHEKYTTDEILAEVRRRLGFSAGLTDMEVFVECRKRYYQKDVPEAAVIEYQQFRQTDRVPLEVGSWVLKDTEPAI